jgi:uncharacterized repeat protein (TIGR03833 family)
MLIPQLIKNISHLKPTLLSLCSSRTISRYAQRKMAPVPRYSQLGPSVPVNIVLKADQPTGKLTRGIIANILTRGDHPRGVKVRLESGAVGRVQSLVVASASNQQHYAAIQDGELGGQVKASRDDAGQEHGPVPSRSYKFQEDVRKTEPPPPSEVATLADYIKAPSRNKKKKGRGSVAAVAPTAVSPASSGGDGPQGVQSGIGRTDQISEQTSLESEFPNIDGALIAAILGDTGSVAETRATLTSLS